MSNHQIQGAADLYAIMLEIKNGFPDGGTRGCVGITKKHAKQIGIEWSFVETSVELLGLKMHRAGKEGFIISK